MTRSFDAIVAGLGAMGSAALDALAGRGLRVLGLDRFAPPHDRGSSHGRSRIIREAYFEHPAYVPLVQRAYDRWADLEREAGEPLLLRTGGLMVGAPGGTLIEGTLRSAREHRLEHERIDAAAIRRRFPGFAPAPEMVGVWEPRAGVLFPERCVGAFLDRARRRGAEIGVDEPVVSWRSTGAGVEVETPRGAYAADRLVLAAGAWIAELFPALAPALAVERVVQHWFEPAGDGADYDPERCPISIWEDQPGRAFYSFPRLEGRVKAAFHHGGVPARAGELRRTVDPDEAQPLAALMRRYQPGAAGAVRESAVCMYTNTPDEHFVIDLHPGHPQVVVVSACSGHGFKFAPAVGEIAAELAAAGRSARDLSMFALGRLAGQP